MFPHSPLWSFALGSQSRFVCSEVMQRGTVLPGCNFSAFYHLPFRENPAESVRIVNTLIAWPQKTGFLPDGAPLLPPAVFLSGVAKNTICCPFPEKAFASPHRAPEDPFLSLPVGIWQQQPFSSHHHALQKGHCVEKGVSISWKGSLLSLSFRVLLSGCLSLFLHSSRDNLGESPSSQTPVKGWGIPRQVLLPPCRNWGEQVCPFSTLGSWRARCDPTWLTKCAIQEQWPRHAGIQGSFSLVALEWRAQRMRQPTSAATEPSHVIDDGCPGDIGSEKASSAICFLGLHLYSPFYEPGSSAFLVILWTAPHHHTHQDPANKFLSAFMI